MMALGKYGMMLKQYLEEHKPVKYNELIINGTIMDYLQDKEKELKDYAFTIEEQVKKKHPAPNTNEFIVMAKYNNMIQAIVDEYVNERLYSE